MQIAVAGKVTPEMTRESIQYAGVVVKGTSTVALTSDDLVVMVQSAITALMSGG